MNATLTLIAGVILAFIGGLLFSRKSSKLDAEIIDLTSKIKQNKENLIAKQTDADQKMKEYYDALKKLDPNFHNDDDDNGGKPAS